MLVFDFYRNYLLAMINIRWGPTMAQKRTGGSGRQNQPLIDFANENNIEIKFTRKGHLQFRGLDGKIVVAAGTPSGSPDSIKRILGQIKPILLLINN